MFAHPPFLEGCRTHSSTGLLVVVSLGVQSPGPALRGLQLLCLLREDLPFSNSCSNLSTARASFFFWAFSSRRFWNLGKKAYGFLVHFRNSRGQSVLQDCKLWGWDTNQRSASNRLPRGPQYLSAPGDAKSLGIWVIRRMARMWLSGLR